MESSLKLLVAALVAVGPSVAVPVAVETPAQVVETPPRVMTIAPLATFNHGKPFLAERDPVTGAFDLRTTPVNSDDYLYEEFEDSGEAIDRKDEGASHTANHIISIPAKDSELHKFLNLPVHYSSASKFPLISSSYANTKIQGHGASNHRPATTTTTTSTVPPSYYPHRTTGSTTTSTTTTTTRRPTTSSTTLSTTAWTTSTTTSIPQPPPAYEYEYEYDYNEPNKPASEPPKSDYDFMSFFNFGASSSSTSQRPIERSTTSTASPQREASTTTSPTKNPSTTTEDRPVSRPTDPTTRVPSTTSQKSKVENEPKPSVGADSDVGKTSPSPPNQESTMIAIKSESIPIRNKTEISQQKQKDDAKTSEVIGLKPPVKTPDSIMKPPPRFGDKIEVAKVENGGWRGKPELSSEYYSSRPDSNSQQSSTVPNQSSGHAKPFDTKPEGSNQVKYSAVNRPHDIVTKRPIEFHSHLVAQVNPTEKEQDKDEDEEETKVLDKKDEEVSPQVVVPISSTPQGLQLSQQHMNTEGPLSSPSEYPPVEPEKHHPVTRPTEPPSRPPTITFPEVESPQLGPQQSPGSDQVYQATINDEKPLRPPASTYLQRPLNYGAPPQHQTEKGQVTTGQVEPDDNVVFNKVSYRPQPGLVSSYQPHPQQHPSYGQQQHPGHVQYPGQVQQQQQGHMQQQQQQKHIQQQQQQHVQQHQGHGQQQQHVQQQHQGHGQQQQGPIQHQGHQPQTSFSQQQQQPAYHIHKVQPQPFGSSTPQHSNLPNGPEDQLPVAWPPKGKPQQDNQKVPPFAFFPRPEQRPTVIESASGVGTVEAVRPPLRKQVPGAVTVSSVSGDTQSYSLQTSFAIGVPSGVRDEGKLTAGTVSAVPVGTSGPISHQTMSVSLQPNVNHQQVSVGQLPLGPLQLDPRQPQGAPHLAQPVSANTIKYPPPPWDGNLNKPYKESAKRKPLPNILPQFRPNAKVGTAEPPGPHMMGVNVNYLREPMDRLQPPPLPPQPRPLHRSDDQHHQPHLRQQPHQHQQHFPPVRPVAAAYHRAENPTSPSPSAILPPQPVHRRNGVGTKVATLQMIQSPPPVTRKAEEPVMIVYPSNNAETAALKGNWRQQPPDFGNDDEFPHDLDNPRTDTPILKGKPTTKPQLKVEFPYPLVKPLPDSEVKEYQAYVPTSPVPEKTTVSQENPISHHLQDYHPAMATSSSSSSAPPRRVIPQEAEFGWSVIGARAEDDMTTTPVSGSSTSGPMAPPQLTGGFRPIPAPNLD